MNLYKVVCEMFGFGDRSVVLSCILVILDEKWM